MPEKQTIERAQKDKREGKSASTQAGEFVREEIHHVREGKHGARSAKQAIAIGLSKARRAGVKLPAPKKGVSKRTAAQARRELKRADSGIKERKPKSRARSRAAKEALEDEGQSAASKTALSRHATSSARTRTKADRSAAARKAARTKGARGRSEAARKAARTRAKSAKSAAS
ncbi:MAG TPA: DUF6496 domain-containing protein [Nannocystaceae bacterium]|nr:DUF6496 domain-containing protein [Nannocystaceae bacterium]